MPFFFGGGKHNDKPIVNCWWVTYICWIWPMRRIFDWKYQAEPTKYPWTKKDFHSKNGAEMCFLWKYDLDDFVPAMLLHSHLVA